MGLMTLVTACALVANPLPADAMSRHSPCHQMGPLMIADTASGVEPDRARAPLHPWVPLIAETSRRFDVPERWIRDVMRVGSGGDATATSPKGAMGLMQVMPETYADLRLRYALGDDPYAPGDNIVAGCRVFP